MILVYIQGENNAQVNRVKRRMTKVDCELSKLYATLLANAWRS